MNHSQRLIAEEAAKYGAKKISKLDTIAEVVNQSIEEANTKPVYRAGDKVQVPFNGKMVTGKVVRFDSGGTDKARQHGGGYVVDVGQRGSVTIPAHLVRAVKKEEVEQVDENNKDFYNYRLVVAGKIVAKGSEQAMMLRAKKHGGLSKGGVEILDPGEKLKKEEVDTKEQEVNEAPLSKIKRHGKGWREVGEEFDDEKDAERWLVSRGWKSIGTDRETGFKSFRKGQRTAFIHVDTTMDVTVQIKEEVDDEEIDTITEAAPIPFNKEIENFLKGLPKEVVADLKKVNAGKKLEVVNISEMEKRMKNIKAVLKKHKIPLVFAGKATWATINLHFTKVHEAVEQVGEITEAQTYMLSFGAPAKNTYAVQKDKSGKFVLYRTGKTGSVPMPNGLKGTPMATFASQKEAIAAAEKDAGVKEEVEHIEEGVRVMPGAEKLIQGDPMGGSSMVRSFRNIKKSLEGKPAGSVLLLTWEGGQKDAEEMSIDIYEPNEFSSLIKGFSKKPEAKVGSKGSWTGGTPGDVIVLAIKEGVEEAYAHPNEKPIGAFTLAGHTKFKTTAHGRFEYRISQDAWGKSHGLPHEVCVSRKDPNGRGDWRSANVKGTVCYIAVDEGADGKPVIEKWAITRHVKYVKAESVEQNDVEELEEAITLDGMGFKKWTNMSGSYRVGRLEGVSADQLVKVFGKPHSGKSSDGKTTMEWGFINQNGLVFTVYDYKNPPKSMSAPHNWSVGGIKDEHKISIQRAFKMMGVPGKMIKEEVEELEEASGFKMNDPRLVAAAQSILPPEDKNDGTLIGKITRFMFDVWSSSNGKTRLPELTRLARTKFGLTQGRSSMQTNEFMPEESESVEEAMTSTDIVNKAKEIVAKAKELGVNVTCEPKVITCSKQFTKGDTSAFFKAYADCDKIRSMVPFKSRTNEWGCSTAGVGIGAQECIKAGMVVLNKSGDGASYVLTAMKAVKNTAGSLARAGIR